MDLAISSVLPFPVPVIAGAVLATGKHFRMHERVFRVLRGCFSRTSIKKAIRSCTQTTRSIVSSIRQISREVLRSKHRMFGKTSPPLSLVPIETPSTENAEGESYVDRVFKLCNVKTNIQFAQAIPYWKQKSALKIAEGSYGEIYRFQHIDGSARVFKFIPVGGQHPMRSYPNISLHMAISDIICSKCLSDLDEGHIYLAPNFPKIHNISLVKDAFPELLVQSWYDYKYSSQRLQDPVEQPPPDQYSDGQMYLTIESSFCGEPLIRRMLTNAWVGVSVATQVASALGVAEASLNFEHRDLHLGNVLLRRTDVVSLRYSLADTHFAVDPVGYHVYLIDFTLSRIYYDNRVCCLGLTDSLMSSRASDSSSKNMWLDFRKMYEIMGQYCGGRWEQYMPVTNVVWLKYLLENILEYLISNNPSLKKLTPDIEERDQMKAVRLLRKWSDCVLSHTSAMDFLKNMVLVNNPRVSVKQRQP